MTGVPWPIDWNRQPAERGELAEQIRAVLLRQPHVASAELFGSLTSPEPDGYPADALSDIDIRVTLSSGSDRDFFETLEPMLSAVGQVLLYGVFVSEISYTGSFMFAGYSPFWKVDVVCYAPLHVPGEDILEAARPERAFGALLSAAKRFVRAGDFLDYFLELAPEADAAALHQPAKLFQELLGRWHRQSGDPVRLDIGQRVIRHLFPPPP